MDNNDNLNSLPDENGESSPEATYESPQADNPLNEAEPIPEAPDFENLEDGTQEKKKKRKPWFSDPVERLEAFNDEFGEDRTEKRIGFLRRTAKEVRRYNVALRILSAALGFMLLLTIILYIIAALYMKTGSFTVRVDKVDMTKYGLTLSESRDMFYSTSHLNAEIEKSITNIAEDWLPDNLGMIDGDHSGANYIAYTFYLQNGGDLFTLQRQMGHADLQMTRRYTEVSDEQVYKSHSAYSPIGLLQSNTRKRKV